MNNIDKKLVKLIYESVKIQINEIDNERQRIKYLTDKIKEFIDEFGIDGGADIKESAEISGWGPSADLEKSINKITADESKKELQRIADELEEDYYSLEDTADFKIPKEMYGDIIKYMSQPIVSKIWENRSKIILARVEFDEAFSICCEYILKGLRTYDPSKSKTGEYSSIGKNSSLITHLYNWLIPAFHQGIYAAKKDKFETSMGRSDIKIGMELLKKMDNSLYNDLMKAIDMKKRSKQGIEKLSNRQKEFIKKVALRRDEFKINHPEFQSSVNKMSSIDSLTNDDERSSLKDTISDPSNRSDGTSMENITKSENIIVALKNCIEEYGPKTDKQKKVLLIWLGLSDLEELKACSDYADSVESAEKLKFNKIYGHISMSRVAAHLGYESTMGALNILKHYLPGILRKLKRLGYISNNNGVNWDEYSGKIRDYQRLIRSEER